MKGDRRVHDMGGLDAGPVDLSQHRHEPWEKRIDAIRQLLAQQGLIRVDELRRGIEDLGPGAYDDLNYYERWCASVTNIMLEKGVITSEELGRKMAEIEARWLAARGGT